MTTETRARLWGFAKLVVAAAVVGLAASYLVNTFPLSEVLVIYDRY